MEDIEKGKQSVYQKKMLASGMYVCVCVCMCVYMYMYVYVCMYVGGIRWDPKYSPAFFKIDPTFLKLTKKGP